MQNAQRTGGYLVGAPRELQARHALIAEVRGAGLFIGVELRHGGQRARLPRRRLRGSSTCCANGAC